MGINVQTVWLKRHVLGIGPVQERPEPVEWTPQQKAQLGTVPDPQLAEEMGVSTTTVLKMRTRLGIPAFLEKRPVARTPQTAQLLRRPNHQVRKETRLNLDTIKRLRRDLKTEPPAVIADPVPEHRDAEHPLPTADRRFCRWRREEIDLLGTAPDAEIARRLGRSEGGVAQKRTQRRIPPSKG